MEILETSRNHYVCARYGHQYPFRYNQFFLLVTAFLILEVINLYLIDQLLINLRKPGETGYKIPVGGMFDYVSGANFFGEIVEWTGFAIAANSPPAFIFALFTAVFLSMRAWHHHNYYLKKFEEYPPSRKIIIPFLF